MTDLPSQDVPLDGSQQWWKLRAGWFYASILARELPDHDREDDVRYLVRCETIGRLELPGGRLVAADPYVMDDEPEPFVQEIGAETAEVVVARATIEAGHERVAALMLLLGRSPVCDWLMATMPGQDVSSLGAGSFFGYGVDAGTGSFGSPEAMKVASRVLRSDAGMLDDPISQALFSDRIGTRSAVLVAPQPGASAIAACSSGWGDGVYPTWLGIDSAGVVVVVITDFLLTGDPYAEPIRTQPAVEGSRPEPPRSWLSRLLGR